MKIFCDGSGFNGATSRCAAIKQDKSHYILTEFDVKRTNNEMEYMAVINGLILAEQGDEVVTDSQLVAYQLQGKYKLKAEFLIPYYLCALELCKLKRITVQWIPREQNIADKLFRV